MLLLLNEAIAILQPRTEKVALKKSYISGNQYLLTTRGKSFKLAILSKLILKNM